MSCRICGHHHLAWDCPYWRLPEPEPPRPTVPVSGDAAKRSGGFDKRAYQREYMRAYRAGGFDKRAYRKRVREQAESRDAAEHHRSA